MHHFAFTRAFAATITLAGAQVTFNTTTSAFICPLGKTAFCAGTSLETNVIIRCNGTVGQPGNCNNNLAGVPPRGVKFAQCGYPKGFQAEGTTFSASLGSLGHLSSSSLLKNFKGYQCSPTAGNAACSYNNLVYPDAGVAFTIAYGDAKCNATNTTLPSSMPMNSMNVSNTLSYATSASTPVALSSASSTIGYPTSEATYLPSSSVRIAPGSGGYNGSNLPIQSFTGDAAKDEASNALAGAVGFAIAILAIMVV